MPTFTSQSPAAATDGISAQNAAGLIAQKSSQLSGPVVTSDFTTTSASLVDVTGMTITLAPTNNVSTIIQVLIAYSLSGAGTIVFGATQANDVTWLAPDVSQITGIIARNANISIVAAAATGISPLLMLGFIPTSTSPSGTVFKIQAQTTAGTLTVKVGSVLYGTF